MIKYSLSPSSSPERDPSREGSAAGSRAHARTGTAGSRAQVPSRSRSRTPEIREDDHWARWEKLTGLGNKGLKATSKAKLKRKPTEKDIKKYLNVDIEINDQKAKEKLVRWRNLWNNNLKDAEYDGVLWKGKVASHHITGKSLRSCLHKVIAHILGDDGLLGQVDAVKVDKWVFRLKHKKYYDPPKDDRPWKWNLIFDTEAPDWFKDAWISLAASSKTSPSQSGSSSRHVTDADLEVQSSSLEK